MEQQVLEGTWEEVSRHASELAGKRVRVTILPGEQRNSFGDTDVRPRSYGFSFGVFSGEPQPTDEDFKSAEFHEQPDDVPGWK